MIEFFEMIEHKKEKEEESCFLDVQNLNKLEKIVRKEERCVPTKIYLQSGRSKTINLLPCPTRR